MERIKLSAVKRMDMSKGYTRELRRRGLIPAVLYGPHTENIPLLVCTKELQKALSTEAGENVIIDLRITHEGKETIRTVIPKEKQVHPTRRGILHVDFCHISLREKLTATVPIEIIGQSPGVKKGGILEHGLWEVEVRCLPADIPEHIQIDVSGLEIGDVVYLKDLVSPEGVEILGDKGQAVLVIAAPKVEKEISEEGIVAQEVEPEVISKRKKGEIPED